MHLDNDIHICVYMDVSEKKQGEKTLTRELSQAHDRDLSKSASALR
jgi:hypothetical protein